METLAYAEAAELLRSAEHILFVTGAGMSADSGLPTYRGVGGLYTRGVTEEGVPIEEALGGRMLRRRPDIAWKYLWQIGSACRAAKPNRGHETLAAIERDKPDTWVLTQNIDGFHRAAGSRNVIEIHGCHSELHCMDCSFETTEDAWLAAHHTSTPELPPRCPRCGGVIRPRAVLFGEPLPEAAVRMLEQVVFERPRDLVVVIGTTGVFPYIQLPVVNAVENDVPTIEINPAPSVLSELVTHYLPARASVALAHLWPTPSPPLTPLRGQI